MSNTNTNTQSNDNQDHQPDQDTPKEGVKEESSHIKEVKKDVAVILISHKQAREGLHNLLLRLAIHVDAHGDITGVQYTVNALGTDDAKGLNNRAVADWLKAFSKVHIDFDKKTKTNTVTYARSKKTDLEGGKAKPWYEFRPSKIESGYSFRDMLEQEYRGANAKLKRKAALLKDGKKAEADLIDVTLAEVRAFGNWLHPKPVPVVSTQFSAASAQAEAEEGEVIEGTKMLM